MTHQPDIAETLQTLALPVDPAQWHHPDFPLVHLAGLLGLAGYLDLALIVLRERFPDDFDDPTAAACRWMLLLGAHRMARERRLRYVVLPDDTWDTLYISAYDLQVEATGCELRRIAQFLERTPLAHLARHFREQLPYPLPRDIAIPDTTNGRTGPRGHRPSASPCL